MEGTIRKGVPLGTQFYKIMDTDRRIEYCLDLPLGNPFNETKKVPAKKKFHST